MFDKELSVSLARIGMFKTTCSSWGLPMFFLFLHSVPFNKALELITLESRSPRFVESWDEDISRSQLSAEGEPQPPLGQGNKTHALRAGRWRDAARTPPLLWRGLAARREGRRGWPQMSPVETSTRRTHTRKESPVSGSPQTLLPVSRLPCMY